MFCFAIVFVLLCFSTLIVAQTYPPCRTFFVTKSTHRGDVGVSGANDACSKEAQESPYLNVIWYYSERIEYFCCPNRLLWIVLFLFFLNSIISVEEWLQSLLFYRQRLPMRKIYWTICRTSAIIAPTTQRWPTTKTTCWTIPSTDRWTKTSMAMMLARRKHGQVSAVATSVVALGASFGKLKNSKLQARRATGWRGRRSHAIVGLLKAAKALLHSRQKPISNGCSATTMIATANTLCYVSPSTTWAFSLIILHQLNSLYLISFFFVFVCLFFHNSQRLVTKKKPQYFFWLFFKKKFQTTLFFFLFLTISFSKSSQPSSTFEIFFLQLLKNWNGKFYFELI